MVQIVVRSPQTFEGRNGDDDSATRSENPPRGAQHLLGVGYVLENVQHEDRVKRSFRSKRIIELSDDDPVAPRSALLDQCGIGFDSLDVTESFQGVEKQSGAATDVKDSRRSSVVDHISKPAQENRFSGAPPPMVLIQPYVSCRVSRVHQSSPPATFATTYAGRLFVSP